MKILVLGALGMMGKYLIPWKKCFTKWITWTIM